MEDAGPFGIFGEKQRLSTASDGVDITIQFKPQRKCVPELYLEKCSALNFVVRKPI